MKRWGELSEHGLELSLRVDASPVHPFLDRLEAIDEGGGRRGGVGQFRNQGEIGTAGAMIVDLEGDHVGSLAEERDGVVDGEGVVLAALDRAA